MLMIMVWFELGLSEDNLTLGGAVRRVNTNVNEFITNNADMSDVDFEDVSVGHGKCFGKQ